MKILITGGASGLGKAITEILGETAENELVVTYNRSENAAKELQKKYGLQLIQCDFNSEKSIENLLVEISNSDIDILINNAFTGFKKQYFHKLKKEDFSENFIKDIVPVLRITQVAIKIFRKKKFGKIINILSSAIINRPPTGWSTYAAGKSYLLSMNKAWAVENSKHNITSNAISPSFMKTDLNKEVDLRVIENMTNSHPLKRLLEPTEVAQSVKYFVEASQHVNGTNLIINAAEDVI